MSRLHKKERVNKPWRIQTKEISRQQRQFLAWMIRRYRADINELGRLYFPRHKEPKKKFIDLIFRAGLMPFYRGCKLVFGNTERRPDAQYTCYVFKYRDNGVNEIKRAPWHQGGYDLNYEFEEED